MSALARAQSLISDQGESVVVREWTEGAVDAQTGDAAYTPATRTVNAARREPRRLTVLRSPAGDELTVDMFWYFKDGEEPAFSTGEKKTRIEPAAGGRYEVLPLVGPAQLGVRQVPSVRMR